MELQALVGHLRNSRGFVHKRDISAVADAFAKHLPQGWDSHAQATAIGDDCAALSDGDGYLLFAIEGFVDDFVERMPWFAGYCGVMVNVSDIYAMGGRPLAVVDALWSDGMTPANDVIKGMAAASVKYRVPIVGGHSNNQSTRGQLAVAIVGRAQRLLSSFNARAGDRLIVVIDLRGSYQEPFPYWNASTEASGDRLRGDLELLPALAEQGLCDAAKDISMAGAIGTALMLLESSGKGARIDVGAIPRPPGVALERWLTSFPSYGFVLSVRPDHCHAVIESFASRGLASALCGEVCEAPQVSLSLDGATQHFWDLGAEPFMSATKRSTCLQVEPS
jgi:AIR synthase-related protein